MSADAPGAYRNRRSPLAGRALLVVGPAASLAPLIAHEAHERGARVALAAPDGHGEKDAAGWARFTSDFHAEGEVDRLYDAVLDRLSGLDVLIAVLQSRPLPSLHELPLECWRQHVAEPLRQTFWLAQRAVDEFFASGSGGRLVFVVHGLDLNPAADTHEIIAEAVISFARSLAREYGRRAVSCNVVLQAGSAERAPAGADRPRPLIECALFLASPAASFVTGEALVVGRAVTPFAMPEGTR